MFKPGDRVQFKLHVTSYSYGPKDETGARAKPVCKDLGFIPRGTGTIVRKYVGDKAMTWIVKADRSGNEIYVFEDHMLKV